MATAYQWSSDHPHARESYLRIADRQAYVEMRTTLLHGTGLVPARARRATTDLLAHVLRTEPVRCMHHDDPDPDAVWGTYCALWDRLTAEHHPPATSEVVDDDEVVDWPTDHLLVT